jgi:hypothetical protein
MRRALAERRKIEPTSFDDSMFDFQYHLLEFRHEEANLIDKALRIALLIYVKTLARPLEILKPQSSRLVDRLYSYVSIYTFKCHCTLDTSPLMLWLLFMGGIAAAQGTEVHMWFLEQIIVWVESRSGTELSWDAIQGKLDSVLWNSYVHEEVGRALWCDVLDWRKKTSGS